jgi:hypothetical protein
MYQTKWFYVYTEWRQFSTAASAATNYGRKTPGARKNESETTSKGLGKGTKSKPALFIVKIVIVYYMNSV